MEPTRIVRALTFPSGDRVVADPGSSEWCFYTGCFDAAKLAKFHAGHPNSLNFLDRSIDIECPECRKTFTQEPWTFLHHKDELYRTTDVQAYLWIRIGRQKLFLDELDNLTPGRADAVKAELAALSRKREEFANYGPKKRLLGELLHWRKKWHADHCPGADCKSCITPGQQIQPNLASNNAQATAHQPTAPNKPPATRTAEPQSNVEFTGPPTTGDGSTPPAKPDPIKLDFGGHYRVGAMCFRRDGDSNGSFFGSDFEEMPLAKFPDQRMRVEDMLSSESQKLQDNPLAKGCDANTLRYFHIPANNMRWVEEAMALYYGEKWRPHDDATAVEKMQNYEKLLSREFWRGQVHGGSEVPVHARHMRPRCSVIPRSRAGSQQRRSPSSGKDIALFLPYLHWEHHALQKGIQREIAGANDEMKAQRQGSEHVTQEKNPLKRRRTAIFAFEEVEDGAGSGASTPGQKRNKGKENDIAESVVRLWHEEALHHSSDDFDSSSESVEVEKKKMDTRPRKTKTKSRASILANLLWRVARVAVEMAFADKYAHDTKMLRSFVHHDPPLHIRRTLDQFYFHTLEDTGNRDSDQVVHRGTRAAKEGKTRIIMVDQLWLWILDDNTIITAFPKRWGRNKLDDSGVHKSIRVRLNTERKDGIKSVYHLALIIIDQCSRVFFDRTKSRDNRPEMLDLFGSAIGNMTELTSISYSNFWRHITAINFDSVVETTAKKWQRFLDINPEGKLLQESQDICEELMILLHVYGQQITVVKEFRRHLSTLKEDENRAEWREAERARVASQRSGNAPGPSTTDSEFAVMELAIIRKLDRLLSWHFNTSMSPFSDEDTATTGVGSSGLSGVPTQEADTVLELMESRRLELQELEDAASRTCNKLEGLLSLKQQQASILEAKEAKVLADESIKQGRSIIAFTVVTIFFLPLGFLAGFFGMNNSVSTDNPWMTLNDQLQYMFGISAAVVVVAISLAFSQTARTALSTMMLPLVIAAEYLGLILVSLWKSPAINLLLRLSKSGHDRQRKIAIRRERERLLATRSIALGIGGGARFTDRGSRLVGPPRSDTSETWGAAVFLKRLSDMRDGEARRGEDQVINKVA